MVISIDKDINDIRNRRWEDLQKHYTEFKEEIVKLDTQNNIVSSINRFRKNRVENNDDKLMNLEKDLNTVRRQIEINQNSSKKKTDYISLLRIILFYLCIMFLLMFTLRSHPFFPYIAGVLTFMMVLYLIKTLWSFYNRDPNRWQLIMWSKGNVGKDEEEDTCLADETGGLNISDEAQKNILLGEILKLRNMDKQAQRGETSLETRAKELEVRKKQLEEMITNLQKIEASKRT